jgi:hypothetical protein
MPLLRVKRHMVAISSLQGCSEGSAAGIVAGAIPLQQQITEPLFEAVDGLQYRVLRQAGYQPACCFGLRLWR